jgi:hypothetical protein
MPLHRRVWQHFPNPFREKEVIEYPQNLNYFLDGQKEQLDQISLREKK